MIPRQTIFRSRQLGRPPEIVWSLKQSNPWFPGKQFFSVVRFPRGTREIVWAKWPEMLRNSMFYKAFYHFSCYFGQLTSFTSHQSDPGWAEKNCFAEIVESSKQSNPWFPGKRFFSVVNWASREKLFGHWSSQIHGFQPLNQSNPWFPGKQFFAVVNWAGRQKLFGHWSSQIHDFQANNSSQSSTGPAARN